MIPRRHVCPILAAALILALVGCLPPGDPPEGHVTFTPDTPPVTAAEARERMITELTTALLMSAPGADVDLEMDNASRADMLRVWPECVKLTGNRMRPGADWVVRSCCTDREWQVELLHRGTSVRKILLPLLLFSREKK